MSVGARGAAYGTTSVISFDSALLPAPLLATTLT
jgi:hypothetical protein